MTATADIERPLEASVANTFDVIGWEIELAGARCIMLDSIIGDVMKSLPLDNRERILEGLHTVDLLSQQLTSLSAFARKMGGSAGSDMFVPVHGALREITLGALADRMQGALGGTEQGINEREEAGDLDLF